MKNKLVSMTGEPIDSKDHQEEVDLTNVPYTTGTPKPRPDENSITVKPAAYGATLSLEETADLSDVRNHNPGPNMLLIQERDIVPYAVKSALGTIFDTKSEVAKGTVIGTVIAVNEMCKPWILEHCKPGRTVLMRNMSGNFLNPNATKVTFIYEQDLISVVTPVLNKNI